MSRSLDIPSEHLQHAQKLLIECVPDESESIKLLEDF